MHLLLAHGLHESEARVYLALLDHAAMPAAALAKVAQVPRSHLYKVLENLHGRGLVDVLVDGRVREYRARPFSEFLMREAEGLRTKLREVEEELRTVAPVLEPPPRAPPQEPEASEVRVVLGRRAVAREIDDLLDRASRRVAFACSDGGWRRALRHLQARAQDWGARSDPPLVEVYLPPGVADEEGWEQFHALPRVKLAWLQIPRSMLAVAVDGNEILFIHPIPDTPDVRTGRDFAIYSRDRTFVANHLDLLKEACDHQAPPAQARPSTGGDRS